MTNRAPLIVVIVLLLLPVLYVGSYLALVVPGGTLVEVPGRVHFSRYRIGAYYSPKFFRPLVEIDRKVRPGAR